MTTFKQFRLFYKTFLSLFVISIGLLGGILGKRLEELPAKPNVIFLLADDMGYGDLWSYGNPTQEWNAIDELAKDGIMFTDIYSPDTVCTPSRASILTGRLAVRTGVHSATQDLRTFSPVLRTGLPHYEYTIAEMMKDAGYTTGMVGKWHLGTNRNNSDDGYYLPGNQGFDYVGHMLPMGNLWVCDNSGVHMTSGPYAGACYLYYNTTVIQQPFEHENLTQKLLADTKEFIHDNAAGPFFFLLSFIHTHLPLFASTEFEGKSANGRYGDNINEMGWAVGEIVQQLKDLNIDRNTLVIFASDNGPQTEMCEEAGQTGLFSGGKGMYYEGGLRIPLIMSWPGIIPAGQRSQESASLMDILPTLTDIVGGHLPTDRPYDGASLVDMVFNNGPTPHEYIFIHNGAYLQFVRAGNLKVFYNMSDLYDRDYLTSSCFDGVPHSQNTYIPDYRAMDPLVIYDIGKDPHEYFLLASEHYEDILMELSRATEAHMSTIEDSDPLLDLGEMSCDVIPCCNPPDCFCNYDKPFLEVDCDPSTFADLTG